MNNIWFKKFGWVFIPVHAMGLLITFIYLALNMMFFVTIDRNSHSIGDTLIQFFVYFTCASFWMRWIAEKTS
jgi:hypothetical protein